MEVNAVLIYSKKSCAYCALAKHELSSRGIRFEEISLDDPDVLHLFVSETGAQSVPQVYLGHFSRESGPTRVTHIGGYTALKDRLDEIKMLLS